ncbi:hypothetical protein ACUSRQ_002344 [Vibrio harveyi]|uniref:hypothetical protein n=3 Tax=Vibrio harveyi TaxID=669 RepID=UPI00215D0E90|nr:hypothetical protein [Vibrio harveyi]EKO3860546.1 hypothetical protein [Vibrio harveyi]EKO3869356.1 hypothetical protein [Vibrio harveyi]MCR9771770.1 hypothetical protein [Vibrio harveyi]HDM8140942.1 hypothetical protein [Vibrio harveyi]HDM8186291.1 hypothetical protein [Vibrio harveyi]
MSRFIKLENLEKFDNCSNRIVKVEPDLYINKYCGIRIFVRDDYFDDVLKLQDLIVKPSMISPSVGCTSDALEDYSEIIAEPVSVLTEIDEETFHGYVYVTKGKQFYISESLFKTLFMKNGVDILVD